MKNAGDVGVIWCCFGDLRSRLTLNLQNLDLFKVLSCYGAADHREAFSSQFDFIGNLEDFIRKIKILVENLKILFNLEKFYLKNAENFIWNGL